MLSLRVGEATLILTADADRKGYIAEELTLEQLQRRNLAQNIELRRRFASYLLSIHSAVNAAVLVLVFLIALNKATLSERVVITLIAARSRSLQGWSWPWPRTCSRLRRPAARRRSDRPVLARETNPGATRKKLRDQEAAGLSEDLVTSLYLMNGIPPQRSPSAGTSSAAHAL